MRKINPILAMLFALVMFSCSSAPTVGEGEFVIHGRLTNVPDSVELRLDDGKRIIAVDTVIDGKFMFRDTITSGVRRLSLDSRDEGFPSTWLDVWVAPNTLTEIKGEDKLLRTWSIESDVQEQKEDNNFAAATFSETKKLMELSVEDADLFRLYSKSRGNETIAKDCKTKRDSIRELEKPIKKIINNKQLEYLKTIPVSSHWMRYYLKFARFLQYDHIYDKPTKTKIEDLYGRMSDSDKQTATGQQISDYLTAYLNPPKKVNVGDDMADADLFDLEGKRHNLSQFKGKYILLDFWSQGCGPCVQSIPELEEVAEIYKDELIVVSINSDNKEMWKKYVTEKKLKGVQWNELKSVSRFSTSYGLDAKPHYVLISPKAKVQSMWSGYVLGRLKANLKEEIK